MQLAHVLPKAVVTIAPPTRARSVPVPIAGAAGPNTDRMENLERQMGVVIQTLSTMTSEMKSFQKAVSNMDVLVRSVQDLQESESLRSGHSNAMVSRSPSSTPPISHTGNLPATTNNGFASPHGSERSRAKGLTRGMTSASTMATDLRIERLVKAAVDLKSPFRVSVPFPIFHCQPLHDTVVNYQGKLMDMVNRLSVFHSVHFEEIPFEHIRNAINDAIAELHLLDKPPTILEFASVWNAEASVLIKTGKRVERKDKSLRSLVLSMFHDRRGKIAAMARNSWRSTFVPSVSTTGPDPNHPMSGVHSLTANSGDCWGMFRPSAAANGGSVVLVVKRKYVTVEDQNNESSETRAARPSDSELQPDDDHEDANVSSQTAPGTIGSHHTS